MNKQTFTSAALLLPAVLLMSSIATATIPGIGRVAGDTSCSASTCAFSLTARAGHIQLGDGTALLAWGYGQTGSASMQYPGPTLIVNQGDIVEVTLANSLTVPVSMVFPGQAGVTVVSGGDSDGLLTREVTTTPVTYRFTASQPGTYLYQSGTSPEVEIEMGLLGALIVRPLGYAEGTPAAHSNRRAYAGTGTAYDRENLFLLTEIDRTAHDRLETLLVGGGTLSLAEIIAELDPASYSATLWFINGRNGPDTMHPHGSTWLPLQPYGALAQIHPGERALMRIVGGGMDLHPFHHHGNNAWLIARDGRVLQSGPPPASEVAYPDFQPPTGLSPIPELASLGASLPDQAVSNFTIQIVPGSTYDAIWTWTGIGLKWDIYGDRADHMAGPGCTDATREVNEDPNSHCVDMPVVLPEQQAMAFGGMWSGSPFLGTVDPLPPLQGGLNPYGGFSFMWHSHTERELTNDDIFPGGMMTMMIVEATPENGGCIDEECAP